MYKKSTAVSKINKESDGSSKDSEEVNLVPRNQPEKTGDRREGINSKSYSSTGSNPIYPCSSSSEPSCENKF